MACMPRKYNHQIALDCLRGQKIIFFGDSSARYIYRHLLSLVDNDDPSEARMLCLGTGNGLPENSNISMAVSNGPAIDFVWDPYLNTSKRPFDGVEELPSAIVLGIGSWYAQHLTTGFSNQLDVNLARFTSHVQAISWQRANISILALPILHPDADISTSDHNQNLMRKRRSELQSMFKSHDECGGLEYLQVVETMNIDQRIAHNDCHAPLSDEVAILISTLILNRLCNSEISQTPRHACCSAPVSTHSIQRVIISMCLVLSGSWLIFGVVLEVGYPPFERSEIRALCILAGVALHCFAADRTSIFEHTSKLVDVRLFVVLCWVFLGIGLLTTDFCPSARGSAVKNGEQKMPLDLLPREQTDEWKGWMQIVILLYHYFGMSKVLWVYKVVRLLVASYLFLTGFGHATYFLQTNDYSLRRFASVLVRMNLLSSLLAFIMDTQYEFYYFPALSSFWFIVVWITMPNTSIGGLHCGFAIARIVGSVIALSLILHAQKPLEMLLLVSKGVGLVSIKLDEMLFRIKLDFLAPFVGMLLAVIWENVKRVPKFEAFLFERLSGQIRALILALGTTLLAFYLALLLSSKFPDKETSNNFHRRTSVLPVLIFLVLRNSTSRLRRHYSRLFAWVGQRSLELFVLQYHIWLAADTKGLLHLGLVDIPAIFWSSTVRSPLYWLECLIISILFVWIASNTTSATNEITSWVVGSKHSEPSNLLQKSDDVPSFTETVPFQKSVMMRFLSKQPSLKQRLLTVLACLWVCNLLSLLSWSGDGSSKIS